MITIENKRLTAFNRSLLQHKKQLVSYAFLALVVAIALSFSRLLVTSWSILDYGQLSLSLAAITGWFCRDKLSLQVLAIGLLALLFCFVIITLFQLGLISAALPVLVAALIISTIIFNHFTGLGLALLAMAILIPGSYLYLPTSFQQWNEGVGRYLFGVTITLSSVALLPPIIFFLAKSKNHVDTFLSNIKQEHALPRNIQYDPLTGLPVLQITLDRLHHELDRSKRDGKLGAVMVIDVDDFNSVNERYGSEAGDMLLRTLAARVASVVRAVDTLSRVGGDTFVAIFADQVKHEQIHLIARKLLATINNPISFNDKSIETHASIGISLFPEHSVRPQDLIALADKAVEQVKNKGGDNYAISSVDL
ncbi:GGDEF domain-containing protein [Teredinibacter haidensis]|uniref:GGDEF domain-containing protein n=1 Tax=Teredinibacter haidensis TaxID=2731755 RepID=UPI000948D5EC|nr:GGDEF domain-containing protein [Teredinibacter haidensis]